MERAFEVLERTWCGVNRFSLVFDPLALRVWFTTYRSRALRRVDFSSFDFSCAPPVPFLDIHRDLAGDAAAAFAPLADEANRARLKAYFKGVNAGFWGNLVWEPAMVKGLQAGQRTVKRPE